MSDQPITDCPACGRQRISVAWCPECGVTTHPDYKRLEARITELEAALRDAEWGVWKDGRRYCPSCNAAWDHGHATGCQLAAALKGGDDERKD